MIKSVVFYLICGSPFAVIEFVSILLIRDGAKISLKLTYALIGWILWPILMLVFFIPNSILKKINYYLLQRLKS